MELQDVLTPLLNTNTALGHALVSMFKSVEAQLVLQDAGPGALKIIVFGGCAVHLYTRHRVSMDVDAEVYEVNIPEGLELQTILAQVPELFVDERSGRLMELNYDLQYNTSFGPIHEDYWERSIPLAEFPTESPLHIHIAAPIDVAISKLGRATDQDIGDIRALLRTGLILSHEFHRLALQAIDVYVGNKEPPTSVLTNILHDYLETNDDGAL